MPDTSPDLAPDMPDPPADTSDPPDTPDPGLCRQDSDCDNGSFCDGRETCNPENGASNDMGCVAGTPPQVDDSNPCTTDRCDEVKRRITHVANGNCRCEGDPVDQPFGTHCFEDVAASVGLATPGDKDGGIVWADLNQDGLLDVVVNTEDNGSHLYIQDSQHRFEDRTATLAPGLRPGLLDWRSVLVADLNHDGYPDIVRNRDQDFEIYLGGGPEQDWVFGVGGAPSFSDGSADVLQFNTEGMVLADQNLDGWLDILVDAQNNGMFVFRNPADGTAGFDRIYGGTLGFVTGQTVDGDYTAAADLDLDGDVDLISRKGNSPDIWYQDGSAYRSHTQVDFNAPNTNKGGAIFCDFDDDGDFDLFYSDGGRETLSDARSNRVFVNERGNFYGLDEPGIENVNVDGVDCGDVDHDGDLDLFVTTGRDDMLFINESDGEIRFVRHNRGIHDSANGEGAVFGDYDRDGDLDLLVNQDDGNALHRNNLNTRDYLMVELFLQLPGGRRRHAHGATVWLESLDGARLSGVRTVSSGKGHGSIGPPIVHFGLPWGAQEPLRVRIVWTGVPVREDTVRVTPSHLGEYQRIEVLRPQ